jgi:hypothetical protein
MVYLASQEFLRFVASEGPPQVQEAVTEPESEQEYEPANYWEDLILMVSSGLWRRVMWYRSSKA